jgi:hypothetical protein
MSRARAPDRLARDSLDAEKVAYWYFRLNGFLQIENFVVHPKGRGSQRTDADLLAVRFPYRDERLIDDPDDIMPDDEHGLSLSRNVIDVVTAEVKANQPCALNGPWTDEDRQNVHRVLAAIGCVPPESIVTAAADIYQDGIYRSDVGLHIRLVAVGREQSKKLADTYPNVTQLTWRPLLAFIWERFHRYRQQKKQVDQWDTQGRAVKRLADKTGDANTFVGEALHLMGVQNGNPAG